MYNVHLGLTVRQDVQCELMAYPSKTDRESILAAALEEVESEGLENLAIRSVAAKLGLAPNALYRYFENLSALELAVAEEVRFQMLGVLQKVIGRKGPSESIRAISEAYLRFAQERPRAFALYLKNSDSADSAVRKEHRVFCGAGKARLRRRARRTRFPCALGSGSRSSGLARCRGSPLGGSARPSQVQSQDLD
jgi:AcrR family transcriptional regulator